MMHLDTLMYWIRERERIRHKKESGEPRPWSQDPVFQTVYFCNVNREDDKTTKFIRQKYSRYVYNDMFLWNIALARLVNRIESLVSLPFYSYFNPETVHADLVQVQEETGKLWGGAYLVSTNGVRMPKVAYVVERVLAPLHDAQERLLKLAGAGLLAPLHDAIMACNGLGSFMSAQIIADLKNTKDHPCSHADDYWTFVAHGPGSLRGMSWVRPKLFYDVFPDLHEKVQSQLPEEIEVIMCSQNLQNCLCEFDKYMRVKMGLGKSKRNYDGRGNQRA
jgi:hypothetical protein